jgi:hypothetical protein
MKKTFSLQIVLIISILFFVACKKEPKKPEKITVDIQLLSPSINDTIFAGDTLNVQGKIISNQEIHGYSVKIRNQNTNMLVLDQGYHEHDKEITFSESWKNNVQAISTLKINVTVAINHDGLEKTVERTVVCIP